MFSREPFDTHLFKRAQTSVASLDLQSFIVTSNHIGDSPSSSPTLVQKSVCNTNRDSNVICTVPDFITIVARRGMKEKAQKADHHLGVRNRRILRLSVPRRRVLLLAYIKHAFEE